MARYLFMTTVTDAGRAMTATVATGSSYPGQSTESSPVACEIRSSIFFDLQFHIDSNAEKYSRVTFHCTFPIPIIYCTLEFIMSSALDIIKTHPT